MYFAQPEYLWLLLLFIPLIAISYIGGVMRRKQQKRFASAHLLRSLQPEAAPHRRVVRNSLLMLTLAMLVLMLARPQMQKKTEQPNEEKGIEAIIALDISNSMLAEDLRPNRLTFAKMTINKLVSLLNQSKVGVVVFAGGAYMQLPITTDLDMVRTFVLDADPTMISNQGSAIGSAIEMSVPSFSQRRDVGKAIIIFTDGEDHDGNAIEAAKKAAQLGIKVYTIAIGSSEGAPIPLSQEDRLSNREQQGNYLLDEEGKMVVTKANPQMCKDIATAGEGALLKGTSVGSLASKINDELKKLPQAVVVTNSEGKHELFGWFACAGIILLLIMEMILLRRNRFFARIKLFD